MTATSFCNALEFLPDECCFTPENHDEFPHASREKLCYRPLGNRKASQADKRLGQRQTSASQAAPLTSCEDHGHPHRRFAG
jgi:hypothetical protein